MSAITKKSNAQLDWQDFEAVFHIAGCTAEYEQQLYYVPLAFEYLRNRPRDGSEFMSGFVNFVSANAARLHDDGLLVHTQKELIGILHAWTREFKVVHFDESACRAKEWSITYLDLVQNSDVVRELVELLLRYGVHRDIAEDFVFHLLRAERSPIDSAWVLELAKREHDDLAWFAAEREGRGGETFESRIYSALSHVQRLQQEFDRIVSTVIERTQSPTYWADVASTFGLAHHI